MRVTVWSVVAAVLAAGCGSDPAVGPDVDSGTAPGAPSGVAASDGTSIDHVAVTWSPVVGAIGYRVWRDGVAIADVAGTSHDDTGADAAGAPAAPVSVSASADLDDRVRITWTAAVPPPGTLHHYAVTARNDVGESERSLTDDGFRGAEVVTDYELAIDGGAFVSIGDVTSHDDLAALAPVIDAGAAAAAPGTSLVSVALTLSGTAVVPMPRTYTVRAVSAAGDGEVSAPATGQRSIAIGPLAYQWQRSSGDADGGYTDLPGATAAAAIDNGLAVGTGRWYRCRVSVAAAAALSTPARGSIAAGVDVPRADTWIANGAVNAVAMVNGTMLLGGIFTYVGPPTGPGVTARLSTGAIDQGGARIYDGGLGDVIPDGSGGWYIVGSFTTIDGMTRTGIARLTAAGTLDPSFSVSLALGVNPGIVTSLAIIGGTMYIGGYFTQVAGQPRNNLAAIDRTTGTLMPWNPNAYGGVSALVVRGNTIYAGGAFTRIGIRSMSHIAAIDAVTGLPADGYTANDDVHTLVLDGTILYAGGSFTSIGGQLRNRVAAIDTALANRPATAWNPDAGGTNSTAVGTIALGAGVVYLGGDFTSVGGQARRGLAAVDAATGAVTPWDPSPLGTNLTAVGGLTVDGDTVYVGGYFNQIGGASRNWVAALSAATGLATSWQVNVSGPVGIFTVQGDTIYLGGGFSSIGGVERHGLAALDEATGAATAWDPGNDGAIYDLVVGGGTAYVGGQFTRAGGQPRNNLAALDLATGAATAWNPDTDGYISTLALHAGSLYAGGQFTRVGAQPRANLAAIDAATGAVTAWHPDPEQWVRGLFVDGGTLYTGGLFTTIAGAPRNRVAAFDLASGDLTAWNPDVGAGSVDAFAVGGGTVYLGGPFATIAGQPRLCLGAVDAATGALTAWHPTADPATRCDWVDAMVVSGSTLYIGGSFFSIGPVARSKLANLDLGTGAVTAWNPNANYGGIRTLVIDGSRLIVAGDFNTIGDLTRQSLAIFEP